MLYKQPSVMLRKNDQLTNELTYVAGLNELTIGTAFPPVVKDVLFLAFHAAFAFD